jgi:hypothetical protein
MKSIGNISFGAPKVRFYRGKAAVLVAAKLLF